MLVIEDEVPLANAVATGLRGEGYDVDVVHDGVDGLWAAQEGQFDAVLLDIMLPSMNGFQVCARLRASGVETPILMLTAKDGEYDEAEGLDTGADDYLVKPFSFVVLLARLRALIRRGPNRRPERLAVGDIELDPATRECWRAGEPVALTPREFAVLEALLIDARAVTKQELIDRVWGLEYEGSPNVAEVYVGYLRNKLDRPYGRDSIQTVRGVGYRIVP